MESLDPINTAGQDGLIVFKKAKGSGNTFKEPTCSHIPLHIVVHSCHMHHRPQAQGDPSNRQVVDELATLLALMRKEKEPWVKMTTAKDIKCGQALPTNVNNSNCTFALLESMCVMSVHSLLKFDDKKTEIAIQVAYFTQ